MEVRYQEKYNSEKLKEVRQNQGLTLNLVARVVGITPGYLSCIEKGKRGLQFGLAAELCELYDIELTDLKVV